MKNTNVPAPKLYPCALTVAGSDSGGGAGIEADLRTFGAMAVYGCAAITAVTAQNPMIVRDFAAVSPAMAALQIETVLEKIEVKAAKTGMLANAKIVQAVAAVFKKHPGIKLIVDPVMISTSKCKLLEDDAVHAMKRELFPLAELITPNIPEAELLLDCPLKNESDYRNAAPELGRAFGCSVLLKSGHAAGSGEVLSDYFYHSAEKTLYRISGPRLDIASVTAHGTGCTLSAAICALRAAAVPLNDAVVAARAFVLGSLSETVKIGEGLDAMYPPEYDYSEEIVSSIVEKWKI